MSMRAIVATMLLLIVTLPSMAADTPVAQAKRAMAAHDYGSAILLLEPIVESDPDNTEAWRLLAAAWQGLGFEEQANEAARKAGRHAGSEPPIVLAAPRPQLSGAFTTGFRYSDNVALVPDRAIAPPNELLDESDFAWFNELRVRGELYRDDDTIVSITGKAFTSFQFDLDDYHVVDLLAVAQAARRMGDFQLTIAAGGGHTWLGGEALRSTGLVGVAGAWTIDDRWRLDGSYRFTHVEFLGNVVAAAEDRDGDYHTFRLGPTLLLDEPDVEIGVYALFNVARTQGASVEYGSIGVESRVRWRPHPNWTVSAGGRYRDFDYDNNNIRTLLTFPRDDQQWTLFAAVEWRFRPNWTLIADVQYVDNDSNIPAFFEYDQTTVGMAVRVAF
jgi:hypothetical protein